MIRTPRPMGFQLVEGGNAARGDDGGAFTNGLLNVIYSDAVELDNRTWRHVSVTRSDRRKLPTYVEMALIKRLFVGDDWHAYEVRPPSSEHINIHEGCLHIWACLDAPHGAVLPDFTRAGSSI